MFLCLSVVFYFDARQYFSNTASYSYILQVDDEFERFDYKSHRLMEPHRHLSVLGSRLRAYVVEPPPTCLVDHWQRRLGIAAPRYADLGDRALHDCLFPLQDLPPELHAVDPDEHYQVYSKAFIAEIDCPQAAVLNQLKIPAVLKVIITVCGCGSTAQKLSDHQ